MELKRKPALGSCMPALSILIGLIEASYILTLAYVLHINEGDCSQPIRLWLQGLYYAFLSHFSIFIMTKIISSLSNGCRGSISILFSIFNSILGLATPIWIIIGSYWYYNLEATCSDTFYEGELATYTILIIYYSFIGSGCCFGCVMWMMMGIGKGITTEVNFTNS
jgi:hypothetical protein